jgi:hypothetical protein
VIQSAHIRTMSMRSTSRLLVWERCNTVSPRFSQVGEAANDRELLFEHVTSSLANLERSSLGAHPILCQAQRAIRYHEAMPGGYHISQTQFFLLLVPF